MNHCRSLTQYLICETGIRRESLPDLCLFNEPNHFKITGLSQWTSFISPRGFQTVRWEMQEGRRVWGKRGRCMLVGSSTGCGMEFMEAITLKPFIKNNNRSDKFHYFYFLRCRMNIFYLKSFRTSKGHNGIFYCM